MKLRNKIFSAITLLFLSTQIHAGIMVEPVLGFSLLNSGTSGTSDLEGHGGLVYGGRLAFKHLGLFVGGEYSAKLGHDLDVVGTSGTSTLTSIDTTNLGVTVGYEFPIMFRAWGTYFLSSKTKFADNDETSGSGFSFGLGWTGLPFVSLNAEYRTVTHDTFFDASTGNERSMADDKYNEVIVSVSLPYTF